MNDNKFINEDNQEIPSDPVIHCLGFLLKHTSSGLSHTVGKIDGNTYFADPKFFPEIK